MTMPTSPAEQMREACARVAERLKERLDNRPVHETPTYTSGAAWRLVTDALADVVDAIRALPAPDEWQGIESAKKDRTVIWAVLHPRLYPDLEPKRPDLESWNGVHLPLRHYGVESDGFDIGWGVAAPVGQGGFPDRWIVAWRPLPAAPQFADPMRERIEAKAEMMRNSAMSPYAGVSAAPSPEGSGDA